MMKSKRNDQGYDQGNDQRNDQRLWFVVQFMIKLIKYDKFDDISIRRIFEKKVGTFPCHWQHG